MAKLTAKIRQLVVEVSAQTIDLVGYCAIFDRIAEEGMTFSNY